MYDQLRQMQVQFSLKLIVLLGNGVGVQDPQSITAIPNSRRKWVLGDSCHASSPNASKAFQPCKCFAPASTFFLVFRVTRDCGTEHYI
jgi:hypothetical protein